MFRFGEPQYLYLLIVLPLLAVFYFYSNYRRRKKLREYGSPELLAHLMPDVSKYRPDVKFWLTLSALAMVIFMLARPQFGSKMETVKRQGVETVVALDISNSMLAQDVTPSRLEKSKKLISRLVETFNNDKVAMIVFAGEAFTQLPITSDYVSAKMFLETISPSLITTQGTDIRGAIDLAMKSFTPNEGVGRAIVLITDGENHEGGAIEAAQEAAKKYLRACRQYQQCRKGTECGNKQTGEGGCRDTGLYGVRRAVPGAGLAGYSFAGCRPDDSEPQESALQECETL